MSTNFLAEKFKRMFHEFPQVTLYLNDVPEHLANTNHAITGYLLGVDDTGVSLAFLYNGNEIRVYTFMSHAILAIGQDANDVIETLRESRQLGDEYSDE